MPSSDQEISLEIERQRKVPNPKIVGRHLIPVYTQPPAPRRLRRSRRPEEIDYEQVQPHCRVLTIPVILQANVMGLWCGG